MRLALARSGRLSRLPLLLLVFVALLTAGCGMFNASASIGPDLRPHLGAGVSVPLGK